MSHSHEMYLWRREFIIRMIPPVRRENAQLTADDCLDLLDLVEILRRSGREVMS